MTTARETYGWPSPPKNEDPWRELKMLKARINELAEIPTYVNSRLMQMQGIVDLLRRDVEELRKATHD